MTTTLHLNDLRWMEGDDLTAERESRPDRRTVIWHSTSDVLCSVAADHLVFLDDGRFKKTRMVQKVLSFDNMCAIAVMLGVKGAVNGSLLSQPWIFCHVTHGALSMSDSLQELHIGPRNMSMHEAM